MKHLLTVIGARPQIIKASAISRAIRDGFSDHLRETVVHTGQHYDASMSAVFLEQLAVTPPSHNLSIGSAHPGAQTGRMMEALEAAFQAESPDTVLLYGDTNSTLAGALAAVKLGIPVAHVEAGMRSFNKSMPEEINRVMADHSSSWLFSPTQSGVQNLEREGIHHHTEAQPSADKPHVYHCGDIMYDNALHFSALVTPGNMAQQHGVRDNFALMTVHRAANTDNPRTLRALMDVVLDVSESIPVVFPMHPRTRTRLEEDMPDMLEALEDSPEVAVLPPVDYLEMLRLERDCSWVATDSGGVQKEAFFFQKPCVILREETEWVEIVDAGAAVLAGTDTDRIHDAIASIDAQQDRDFPPIFGDGKAAEFIIRTLLDTL